MSYIRPGQPLNNKPRVKYGTRGWNSSGQDILNKVKTFDLLPSETVMPDEHLVYAEYVYIVDGVFQRCWYHGITVAEWKIKEKIKEVRRCDLFGHPGAKLGDKVKVP